jgi:predicted transcriptional regulator
VFTLESPPGFCSRAYVEQTFAGCPEQDGQELIPSNCTLGGWNGPINLRPLTQKLHIDSIFHDSLSNLFFVMQNIILYDEGNREKLSMKPKTVSFRIEEENLIVVDEIARAQGVDRTAIINAAIEQHIAYYRWSCEHIQKALNSTEIATEEEVQAEFDKWKQSE